MSRGKPSRAAVTPAPLASIVIHVQPRARRTEIVGRHGDAIKIRVAAPPVDGAANEELLRFLSTRLDLPASRVRLAAGGTGRRKRVQILGLNQATAMGRLGVE